MKEKTAKAYQCLFNEDMGCIGLTETRVCPTLTEPITREHVIQFVKDAENTAVDALLCCPTMLRQPLWRSDVLNYWSMEAATRPLPMENNQRTPSELIYERARDYIVSGGDPLTETFQAVKKAGMDFFISYRMNDWHFLECLTPENAHRYPTVDAFYLAHPDYRIGSANRENPVGWDIKNRFQQNYLIPEVRDHYMALLTELVERYDVDGLELDFMRSPNYFPLERLAEGTAVMTAFVRQVRQMLDAYGDKRDKRLALCVKMPHRFAYCAAIGFDLKTWAADGFIDMVNVTSSYFHSEALELEIFKQELPQVCIYGEMQAVLNNWIDPNGFVQEHRTPKEVWETTAHEFLQRGADGVSLFNYQFLRQSNQAVLAERHSSFEPSGDILKNLTNQEYLEHCPKYHVYYGYSDLTFDGRLPGKSPIETTVYLWEKEPSAHQNTVLRLVFSEENDNRPVQAFWNGVDLQKAGQNKPPFPDVLPNGQFPASRTQCFLVPTTFLKPTNALRVVWQSPGDELFGVELALDPA